MLVSAFILVVPMLYIFIRAFSKGLMPVLENPANPDMLHAIWLTVMIALITVPVNLVFGTLLARLVTRFTFPGRQLLLTLLDIPFAVSPVVAGLVYLLFYGSNGPLGGWLATRIICKSCSPGRAWCWRPSLLPVRLWCVSWCR